MGDRRGGCSSPVPGEEEEARTTTGEKEATRAGEGVLLLLLLLLRSPKFGVAGATAALSPASSILLCMLSTAYLAHYNAPKYYVELKDNTIKRYNQVVMAG